MPLIQPANENEEPLRVTPDEADEIAEQYEYEAHLLYDRCVYVHKADRLAAMARRLRNEADAERQDEARLLSPCAEG